MTDNAAYQCDYTYTQLAAAVITQAVRDVISGDEEMSLEAFEFLYVREDDGVSSVKFWCAVLGWAPTRLRRSLHAQYRGRLDWLAAGYAIKSVP